MSLEAEVKELKESVLELTKVTRALMELRADAIEKVGAVATKVTTTKKKDADEPKANISSGVEDRKNPEEDVYEGVKELIASYIGGTDRAEEREARKEKMRALLNHEKVKKAGVETAAQVDDINPDAVPLFKDQVNKLIAKGDLTEVKKASDDLDL